MWLWDKEFKSILSIITKIVFDPQAGFLRNWKIRQKTEELVISCEGETYTVNYNPVVIKVTIKLLISLLVGQYLTT